MAPGSDIPSGESPRAPGIATPVATAFCRVQITVAPQIKIEVWLPPPASWNHRFQAEGGGGYAGTISYSALARAVVGDAQTGQYATASTATGHPAAGTANGQGGANGAQGGGGFALDPVTHQLNDGLIVDFASRSLHEMTLKAKTVIRAYYGQAQKYAYWVGCSTGGRQGWMEAQRFPEDYDGILAGAPAFNWDRFIPAELWPELVMNRDVGAPIPMAKLIAVNVAAVKACDELDGVKDGVIADPRACNFSWSDQLIFPRGSIDYYQRVVKANGGVHHVRKFDRLFMVAGMNHCAGGAGPVNFGQSGVTPAALDPDRDAVLALQRWVEQGVAPDKFIATTDPQPAHATENPTQPATFTRPLCPYPEEVRYVGGDKLSASSFTCVWPHGDDGDDEDEGGDD